jgi:hypothetical protein
MGDAQEETQFLHRYVIREKVDKNIYCLEEN